ncbi:bifunctional 3-(3-hydroxy-phenyl)propionate/3-hydroxycinnamic acid hydroxylase [Sphingomonas sp. LB3N6]|uniref:bifunctional 3-(3-hydroxy-phenyl)propionate/3-hydroxycinnamic acid hydroxylase MhpA n=1 Tax=Sphingomonas fucosidasi TaxID=3096164 RepID=UPI002FCC5D7C
MLDFDTAIIGCGPVGGTAANLLGQAGLRVVVIEQQAAPYPLPRAVHIDHEVMRIFQSAGLDDVIRPQMRDTQGHLHIGADGGVLRYLGTAGKARQFGWSNDYFFYQPELETALRAGLARFPHVSLRFGEGFEGLVQDDDGVTVTIAGGTSLRVGHVIACDGASSPVRKVLGVPLVDLDFEEPWLVVDAEVDGPVRFPDFPGLPEGADVQQLSVMLCDPRRPATIVPGRGNHRRWEFMLLPGEDDLAMREPDVVDGLIAPWIGDAPARVIRAATYRFHGLLAEQWQVGRVFLAGDAAHQTPPFFGQGMCHGMRDVANLAWKLALVARRAAPPSLLDGYQREREPQVRAVIAAAVETGRYICERDPAAAAARDVAIRAREADRTVHTAADLIVPIHGMVRDGDPGGGARFIQPRVTDNDGTPALLDDVTGGGFVLIAADGAIAEALDQATIAAFAALGGTVYAIGDEFADAEGTMAQWLAGHEAVAVLVRPDFYVYGTAASRDGVVGLVNDLLTAVALAMPPRMVAA